MTDHTPFWQRLRRFIGIKSEDEIERELELEPHVMRANKAIQKADRVIRELEALERRKTHR